MKNAFQINLEYYALRSVHAVINLTPEALVYAAARFFAAAVFTLLPGVIRRRRTEERIRLVFPGKTAAEVRAIASASFTNLLLTAVEMMRSTSYTREWMDRRVPAAAGYAKELEKLVGEGRGVVIMVPHSGNWYMAAWAMAKYGVPLCALAARQRNYKIDAWMNRQYRDIEVFDRDKRETLRLIVQRLGEGRAFAILPDLRVRREDVAADFFGGKANVSRAGALFAVKAGSPIVVAVMRRRGKTHEMEHLATLRPSTGAETMTPTEQKEEAARLTCEAMKILSDAVMKSPGDWFWYNKRWILEGVSG